MCSRNLNAFVLWMARHIKPFLLQTSCKLSLLLAHWKYCLIPFIDRWFIRRERVFFGNHYVSQSLLSGVYPLACSYYQCCERFPLFLMCQYNKERIDSIMGNVSDCAKCKSCSCVNCATNSPWPRTFRRSLSSAKGFLEVNTVLYVGYLLAMGTDLIGSNVSQKENGPQDMFSQRGTVVLRIGKIQVWRTHCPPGWDPEGDWVLGLL